MDLKIKKSFLFYQNLNLNIDRIKLVKLESEHPTLKVKIKISILKFTYFIIDYSNL